MPAEPGILHENQDAYRRLRIHYRVLCDVSQRSMVCKIFDSELAMPILAAPTAFHRLVVTCDAPCWGVREADIRNGFHLPPGIEPVNLTASDLHGSSLSHRGAGMGQIMSWMLDPSLTWKDIESIASEVKVPVIVKGICRADDALQAVRHGASGIIVSNHGGRQLDCAPATIEALPAVVKAIAFGANAVLVGRPVLWGLATGGESGVMEALEMLQKEFDLAMALSGSSKLEEITPDLLGRT
jgi:4-hydroxymandelate oxidase